MRTKITSCQEQELFKISNGIRIHREKFFGASAQTIISLKRPASPSLGGPLFIVSLVAIAVSSIFFSFPIFYQPALGFFISTTKPIPSIIFPERPGLSAPYNKFTELAGQAGLGIPVRIKVPKINVDAALEPVGLTSGGALAVPKSPTNAGWYNMGPRPGEEGSSVIDGHFGRWKNGAPAVFDNLNKLHKGDKLYIEDEKGVTTAFVVRESRRYDPNAEATEVFGSSDGKSHLNLITCEGTWNATTKSYSDRLVVFADKEMQ